MAQTKRKRKRRHRGTQAGTIERAGRTTKSAASRPKKSAGGDSKAAARERRQARFDRPPTWRGSLNRAAFAAAILVVFIAITQHNLVQAVLLGLIALVIYVPMSYWTDGALYRRRKRRGQISAR